MFTNILRGLQWWAGREAIAARMIWWSGREAIAAYHGGSAGAKI